MNGIDFSQSACWYDDNAASFISGADPLDTGPDMRRFLDLLPVKVSPRILDIGCGSGRDLEAFQALGCRIGGIDPSAAMIGNCRARLKGEVMLEQTDLGGLFMPPASWDGVWAMASLLHIPLSGQEQAWCTIAHHLAPGGAAMAWVKAPKDVDAREFMDERGRPMCHYGSETALLLTERASMRYQASVTVDRIVRLDSRGDETIWTEILMQRR